MKNLHKYFFDDFYSLSFSDCVFFGFGKNSNEVNIGSCFILFNQVSNYAVTAAFAFSFAFKPNLIDIIAIIITRPGIDCQSFTKFYEACTQGIF